MDYKDYNSITRLFHFACKAERQVQGRQNKGRGNFSAGHSTSWTHTHAVPSVRESTPAVSNNGARSTTKSVAQVSEASPEPVKSSYSTASTGRTRDVLCHGCGGRGHIKKECPNKRVLIVRENGEYSSASDLDEDTHAMLSTNPAGDPDDPEEIHCDAYMADKYPSLITMRVPSAQEGRTELHQRHNLFQTKFVVKEHSVHVIIDGGSCNNLASIEMVEKLCLTTTRHPVHITFNVSMNVVS